MGKKYHVGISIKEELMSWRDKRWMGSVRNSSGKVVRPEELKERFLDELEQGHTLMLVGDSEECPDFDCRGGGCPGHEVTP